MHILLKNILHISQTPLVGAPFRLSNLLKENKIYNSSHHILKEYPNHLKNLFPYDAFFSYESINFEVDIVWIHNIFDIKFVKSLKKNFRKAQFILQVHSTTHEGPLFNSCLNLKLLKLFDKHFVISQAHPRLYPSFHVIPNVCMLKEYKQSLTGDFIKILLSPSGINKGRFSNKGINDIDQLLQNYNIKNIHIDSVYNLHQDEVMDRRSHSHINVDDIKTGGFHQVSLEALYSGGLAFNGADIFSKLIYSTSILADELPPFIQIRNNDEFVAKLKLYLFDNDLLRNDINLSRNFAKKYLSSSRLSKIIASKLI